MLTTIENFFFFFNKSVLKIERWPEGRGRIGMQPEKILEISLQHTGVCMQYNIIYCFWILSVSQNIINARRNNAIGISHRRSIIVLLLYIIICFVRTTSSSRTLLERTYIYIYILQCIIIILWFNYLKEYCARMLPSYVYKL